MISLSMSRLIISSICVFFFFFRILLKYSHHHINNSEYYIHDNLSVTEAGYRRWHVEPLCDNDKRLQEKLVTWSVKGLYPIIQSQKTFFLFIYFYQAAVH